MGKRALFTLSGIGPVLRIFFPELRGEAGLPVVYTCRVSDRRVFRISGRTAVEGKEEERAATERDTRSAVLHMLSFPHLSLPFSLSFAYRLPEERCSAKAASTMLSGRVMTSILKGA